MAGLEPGAGNPIHELFDEIGLPWRESRGDIVARCGIRPHPAYGSQIVPIPTRRPLTGDLLGPLYARADDGYAAWLPITEFSGETSVGNDARINIAAAARPLANRLGRAPILHHYNTITCRWRAGATAITLTVWPPDQQSMHFNNPAHDRDPRLATACHVAVQTGFRPPLSAEEAIWLSAFEPLLPAERAVTLQEILDQPAAGYLLEFTREPALPLTPILGRVGRARGGEALIICSEQLYVVPADALLGFEVNRLTPAKGGGGSWLSAKFRAADPGPVKSLTIASRGGTHDLDEIGPALAARFGKPCELAPPYPDC